MKLGQRLEALQALDLSGHLSLWIIHRHLDAARKAVYNTRRVNIEKELQRKLRELVRDTIASIDLLSKYNYDPPDSPSDFYDDPDEGSGKSTTPPHKKRAFVLRADEGGFDPLREEIDAGLEAPTIDSEKELVSSSAFVTKIDIAGGEPLYAFLKVSDAWTTKKVGGFYSMNTFFKGGMLVDLDDRPVFQIDRKFDFIGWDNDLFIFDRDAFEKGLNFREALERQRDQLVEELAELQLFANPEVFAAVIGNRLPLLRKFDSIRRNGYYKEPEYVQSMIAQAETYQWPLPLIDGKIMLSEELVPIILRLLNNDRLQSPINAEFFDVTGKERVSASRTRAGIAAATSPKLTIAKRTRVAAKKAPPSPARRKRARAS